MSEQIVHPNKELITMKQQEAAKKAAESAFGPGHVTWASTFGIVISVLLS